LPEKWTKARNVRFIDHLVVHDNCVYNAFKTVHEIFLIQPLNNFVLKINTDLQILLHVNWLAISLIELAQD
jgi:hypothetical protein